ncbi:hypothetical protein PAPYR_6809 [Paratrimastix pyriformis]|uniref:Uncharacterized protein n=1 Tax=Paratrimastix pyriformis TaxID=342808 RepID=A0ABQ8UK55_9EUKA|nr:hypothetical protein PAPYR_6809 [Paratrimastix pyriformis]
MRAIVEASPSPDLCYILMLSISHTWRVGIRGTLRELSFGEPPDPLLAPITSDALAALLAVLTNIPPLVEPVAERLMSHLPGLVEFTASKNFDMSTRLLAALARSCPGLQVLRCPVSRTIPPDFAALGPLSGALKALEIRTDALKRSARESLSALVCGLTVVTSLKLLCSCPPAALEPLASHLTDLELSDQLDEQDLPGPLLCRLETLSLALDHCPFPSVARLLSANQATLRSLSLDLITSDAELPALMVTLRALPHLTRLDLSVASLSGSPVSFAATVPPDLVDRLEDLRVVLCCLYYVKPAPTRIASGRLQRLRLDTESESTSGLALDCPALLDLDLQGPLTALHCPRLRTLTLSPQSLDQDSQSLDGADLTPMPDLEVSTFSRRPALMADPAWLLLAGSSPRLRELSGLHLDVTRLPNNPLVLRLPGQLERLDLHIGAVPGDMVQLALEVEAPGLVDFALDVPGPSSVRLRLRGDEGAGGSAMMMQPRRLRFHAGLDAASLLGLLARHGSRLRDLTLAGHCKYLAADDWPRLMRALSGLPRLTDLAIDTDGVPSTLSLACPHLRSLDLYREPGLGPVKVALDCPLLTTFRHNGSNVTASSWRRISSMRQRQHFETATGEM